jgi:hypothetical protein
MGDSSNKELPSSSNARRKQKQPSGMDEKDTDSQHEEDNGDNLSEQPGGEEGGEVIDEEHKNGEETGPDVPSSTQHWKSFCKAFNDKEEIKYGSVDDWFRDLLELGEQHGAKLHSMSKD